MKKLFFAICLVLLCSTCYAGSLVDSLRTEGKRTAVVFNEACYIPYNIEAYGYQTGLHIVPDARDSSVSFIVAFFSGADFYAMREIAIGPEGWTGYASALLPAGVKLQTPTIMVLVSTGTINGRFWATQFIFTGAGFSHVVLESKYVN